jgi:hypothetical protein
MTADAIYFFLFREAKKLLVMASICSADIDLPVAAFLAPVIIVSSFGSFFCRASASICQARDIRSSRSRFLPLVTPSTMRLISLSVSRQNSS